MARKSLPPTLPAALPRLPPLGRRRNLQSQQSAGVSACALSASQHAAVLFARRWSGVASAHECPPASGERSAPAGSWMLRRTAVLRTMKLGSALGLDRPRTPEARFVLGVCCSRAGSGLVVMAGRNPSGWPISMLSCCCAATRRLPCSRAIAAAGQSPLQAPSSFVRLASASLFQ